MTQLKGKQLFDASIEISKLSSAAINTLKYVQDAKDACRMAAIENVNIAVDVTVADIDGEGQGVTLVEGDRVMLTNQSDASENFIYTVGVVTTGTAPLTRSEDADIDAEVTHGAAALITEGSQAESTYFIATLDPIVVDTTNISMTEITPFPGNNGPVQNDKGLSALLTTTDDDQGGPAISGTPLATFDVAVLVNGLRVNLKGNKTGDCFFSADGGTTAKSLNGIVATDTMHWVGSNAGYELETTDILDYEYTA